jgi:hypothetical protein
MHVVNTTTREILAKPFYALLLMCFFSAPAFTQSPAIQENAQEMQVKYLAGDNDAMLFNLKYDNQSGNDFKLMVLNETGDVLFQKNYSGKKFKKKIKLTRLTETADVTFLISSPRQNIQLSRKVKVTNKVVDDASLAANQ